MEKHKMSPIDTEGIIGVLAWSACDREGRRRLVAVKREKTMLVATMKQDTMMRARQEEEFQELRKVIKCMNARQGKFVAMMEQKEKIGERSSRGSSEKDIPGRLWTWTRRFLERRWSCWR